MFLLASQVLASKTPALLDFHKDLVSLEAASKVHIISICWIEVNALVHLKNNGFLFVDTIEIFGRRDASHNQRF